MILTPCDRCTRGVVPRPGGWGDPCRFCIGQGVITLSGLAKLIDEWPDTLANVLTNRPGARPRVSTCSRICGKIADLCLATK